MTLTVNIKSAPYSAVGDGQLVTTNVTLTSGSNVLTVSDPIFAPSDFTTPNKGIVIDGMNPDKDAAISTTITGYTSATQVTLAVNSTRNLSAVANTVCWGTNDSPAFATANAAARLASGLVTYNIPSGIYYLASTDANDVFIARGISQFKMVGIGAPTIVNSFSCGGIAMLDTNEFSARIDSVKAGVSSAHLQDLTKADRFVPGYTKTTSSGIQFIAGTTGILAGLDPMGFGTPANPVYWEYVTITGVNAGTGIVTFSRPIKNDYLSTWPLYNSGGINGPNTVDCGGPATLYILDKDWNCSQEYIGMKFHHPTGGINSQGQTIKYTTCSWVPNNLGTAVHPSVNELFQFDGCSFPLSSIEVDKMIQDMKCLNSSGKNWWFQSCNTENLLIDNSTITTLQGTPKRTIIQNNSHITNLIVGTQAYGVTESVRVYNSQIDAITQSGAIYQRVNTEGGFSISNGVLSCTAGPVRFAVPNTHYFWAGQQTAAAPFHITTVSGNGSPSSAATVTYTQMTNALNDFPNIPKSGGTRIDAVAHPCPSFYATDSTGCPAIVELCEVNAQNKPLYSYSKRTYTIAEFTTGTTLIPYTVWGHLIRVIVTVNTPFTTAGPFTFNCGGQFGFNVLTSDYSASAASSFNPVIDLRTGGTRTFTPSLITSTAVGGSDSLGTAPGRVWFCDAGTAFVSKQATGGDPGSVTVEIFTDQLFPNQIPVGLRLH